MSTDKISVWELQWAKGETSFHLPEVNTRLLAYMNELVGVSGEDGAVADPAAKNILVPLCGKSRDLIHLHALGHSVVGCEVVEQACIEFFRENQIEYSRSPIEEVEGALFTVSIILQYYSLISYSTALFIYRSNQVRLNIFLNFILNFFIF